MLTIHGVTRSRTSRIIWLCHEIGVDFKQIPVIQAYRLDDPDAADAPLNTRSPQFLKLSPAGAVPVLQDDGLTLFESMACNLHLARKYGQPFGPADAQEDALMSQWSFYAATSVEPDALTILYLHGSGKSLTHNETTAVSVAAERLTRPMKVIEDHLGGGGYMVSQRFTVADINVAEVLRFAQSYTPLMEQFPATQAWLTDCQKRPAFQKMWEARQAEPA